MGLIALLFENPAMFFILAVLLLYSIIAHEVAHGWVALRFGDDTALRYGRLTFNPVPHIDPMGVLMLFLFGFGWARPVPIDYSQLENTRLGIFCVALAGCVANILIAAAAIFLLLSGNINDGSVFSAVLKELARINIMLGAFNLIPIPPLDGSKILMTLLPEELQMGYARVEPYGFYILIFLLFTGLLNPVIGAMQDLIYSFITLLLGFFK